MGISTPTLVNEINHTKTGPWALNYHTADIAAGGLAAELKAAPTDSGGALYLTHVTMGIVASSVTGYLIDNAISLAGGDGTTLIGPIQMQAQGSGLFKKDFTKPIKVADKKALDCTVTRAAGSYNTAAFIYVEGFTAYKPIT